jgi:small subunit ribosomal protein S19
MARAKWKGPFIKPVYLKKINKKNHNINKFSISRKSEVMPNYIGLTFQIHNGKNYSEIKVSEEMLGHKFGEFVFTRSKFSFKKKKSQK